MKVELVSYIWAHSASRSLSRGFAAVLVQPAYPAAAAFPAAT